MRYDSMFTRLLANSEEPESSTGCWLWSSFTDPKGYGKLNMRIDGKHVKAYAHREMEHSMRGDIEIHLDDEDPFGPIIVIPAARMSYDETIDHLCWNTQCINPDHFEVVTRSENSIRKVNR